MNTIPVELKTEQPHVYTGVYQHDYGQILQIHGKNLPAVAEVQFSLHQGGQTETRVGVTTNDVLEVQVPDKMLKNEEVTENYCIFAYLYITDGKSGNTEYKITIHVTSRPAPGKIGEDPDESHILDEAVNAVNAAAERAETAEAEARSAADSATAAAESARKSAEAVAQKKNTAISVIQNRQAAAEKAITDHTDAEIARLDRETQASEDRLTKTIRTANDTKEAAENTISEARRVKESLDISVQNATKEKEAVEASTSTANAAKKNLDQSTADANVAKTALDKTIQSADDQNTSLGEKIETSKQLKTDLQTAGEKATQDIQTAGSEQLGKMQAVAEEFTADREQIATNKKDIGSLKEDISNKITKFYASNRGETHLADSDKGKIMDMMLYGKSEQKQYSGKNLINSEEYYSKYKQSDGTYKGRANDFNRILVPISKYIGTQITVSCKVIVPSVTSAVYVKATINGTAVNGNTIASNKSGVTAITIVPETENDTIVITYGVGGDGIIVVSEFQIEKGSEATSYEPYTGGIPSPNPDYPQEIKSVVNPTVKVSSEDETESQTVALPYTFNAIPVSSGGNVTIGKQQYISDYLDIEKGKLYRKVKRLNLKDVDVISIGHGFHSSGNGYLALSIENVGKEQLPISNRYRGSIWTTKSGYVYVPNSNSIILVDDRFTDKQTAIKLVQDTYVIYALSTPIEEDLSLEQIKSLKSLSTNYPVTNITVDSEELDGYAVFNYPISMENGWNYVKQQLGDTRDYIYDMDAKAQDIDIQSAEAYVNSEYAVALTELEI